MHEQHDIMESDDLFVPGTMEYLVPGNEGRVLDGRRTPGYIEAYDMESCMFIWRITAFEDKGKCWEIPAEEISSYQFRIGSSVLSEQEVQEIAKRCRKYQEKLAIPMLQERYSVTQALIADKECDAEKWINAHSIFVAKKKHLDFQSRTGDADLYCDLESYMMAEGMLDLERKTAEQYLLNPYSGEWLKGMKIVMAELGLIAYNGPIPRTKNIFCGIGSKGLRKEYIISRAAFLRALFKREGIIRVPLYRGMASYIDLFETSNTLVSASFSADTAKEFASVDNSVGYISCYWVKFHYPVENLFMTYLETRQFNQRYKEQEAIIYYRDRLTF